jgi:hypothetical protein
VPDWEITVTTVRCDTVDEEVTILVNGDATVTCTGHQRYAAGRGKDRPAACQGNCGLITETIARFKE